MDTYALCVYNKQVSASGKGGRLHTNQSEPAAAQQPAEAERLWSPSAAPVPKRGREKSRGGQLTAAG